MSVTVSNLETSAQLSAEPDIEAAPQPIETYAQQVASALPAARVEPGTMLPVLKQWDAFEATLRDIHRSFSHASEEGDGISYAREWLLDNFYIIQRALHQVKEDLPPQYYGELPKLVTDRFAGLPRIYAIARAFATFTEGQVASPSAQAYLVRFQETIPLTMGELWAWPGMLRLCAQENLIWALEQTLQAPTFSAQLPHAVKTQLAQDHPAPQLMVASSIGALRTLDTLDWPAFFESVSRVEGLLRHDPARVYARMDFETRNQYRGAIERLAAASGHDEETIAQAALDLAQAAVPADPRSDRTRPFIEQREAHVGYYLVDRGYGQLLAALHYRPLRARLRQGLTQRLRAQLYIGAIVLLSALITLLLVAYARLTGGTLAQILGAGLVAFIPASAIAVHFVNRLAVWRTAPSRLPKLDFSEGIPAAYRTVVVIPALLTDAGEIDSLAAQLELHYLRNTDANLRFALLADYGDAAQEHLPEDEALLDRARTCVTDLNARHGTPESGPFYLFVRGRRWNAAEACWMGYERKRGKLAEFNRLLLDPQAETSYFVKQGDLPALAGTRYVITLDADTLLPHQAASRLAGTMAHPLNQPLFAEDAPHQTGTQRQIAGYTVLQPRVELLPTVKNRTLFAHVMGGDAGFDLYTLAVSDVYQDLFGEGIYVGKGIYDVAAFEHSLGQCVPENALLSHDLFEGIHSRAGLVTDVVLVEDYPTHYLAFSGRLHRWIRGDWQLLPWLLPRVPTAGGAHRRNTLSLLSYWKIVDNLRRSLERPALLLLFLVGWLWRPGSAFVWMAFALGVLWIPFMFGAMTLARAVASNMGLTAAHETQVSILLARWALALAFLPYEAMLTLDAIVRTLIRLVRRRSLLEWTTAASAMRLFGGQSRFAIWQHMLGGSGVTLAIGLAIVAFNPGALVAAAPLLILWTLAPAIAARLSRPYLPQRQEKVAAADLRELRRLARRTWLFFEAFVGPDDHWLIPDHYQREPHERIKHYTSPTNIGLMLLSSLAAYDLGYIGLLDLMLRTRFAFDSIAQLERYRGHLLNWYHTQYLKPLSPRYVSTVDSGNYAGCLLALKVGYHNLAHGSVLSPQRWQGLVDTLDVIGEILATIDSATYAEPVRALDDALQAMRRRAVAVEADPARWAQELNDLTHTAWPALNGALEALNAALEGREARTVSDLHVYLSRTQHHLFGMQRDLEALLPWQILFQRVPPSVRAAGANWDAVQHALEGIPCLGELEASYQIARGTLDALERGLDEGETEARLWCRELTQALEASQTTTRDLLEDFATIEGQIDQDLAGMDFSFLYDTERDLFHIGYNVETEQPDANHYDLLASEARLASYIAIAKGDVPYKHWLHLGRPITLVAREQVLHSWSGTLFEYLMPLLLMRQEANTLLSNSTTGATAAQIAYADQHDVPWGISESGFYVFDIDQNYQYRAFGVPELALKRGQDLDLVVAPYASMLALPLRPAAVAANLHRLAALNALQTYGLVEAIDYTATHLPLGKERALVNEYMAHHQGMIFVALTNFLQQDVMVRRFHADPSVKSIELLLMEQIPPQTSKQAELPDEDEAETPVANLALSPWEVPVDGPLPQAHYLSNGRYAVMITSAGGGYSQWHARALTRWRADTTLDNWGTWLYIRDCESDALWSAGYQPIGGAPEKLQAIFHPHKAEFLRREYDVSTRLEIVVPPDNDLEIRRLSLTNHSAEQRRLLVCSYGEMVLTMQDDDRRHPVFNQMFIESEYLPDLQALLFHRRPRSAHEEPLYVLHRLVLESGPAAPQYETDRARFLGRNRTPAAPQALTTRDVVLSGTTGATLDPVLALAQAIEIEPHGTTSIAYLTVAGSDRADVISQARAFNSWGRLDHALDQARYRTERELQQLELNTAALERIQTLFSALLFPHPRLRARPETLAANTQAQPRLWAHGISGDYPIVLAEISAIEQLGIVRELLQAHTFWRNRGIKATLVILNTHDIGYEQALYNQLYNLIGRMDSEVWLNRHDGIFIVRGELLDDADRILLRTAARIYMNGELGTLSEQLAMRDSPQVNLPALIPTLDPAEIGTSDPLVTRPDDLVFDNGYGGFTPDGHEYVITLTPDRPTPAPWANVIANAQGGFLVTESGGGFTWAYNSGENRLTPWRNDPVTDMPGEALYLRDEETGTVWSPTPLPVNSGRPYRVRHGMGYSVFEHACFGIEQTVRYAVAPDDPVKFVRIRLKNTSPRPRRITVTYYVEWVLGPTRDITQQYLIPEYDPERHVLLVHNPYSIEFGKHRAFLTASQPFHGLTTDRTEFLGRMASYAAPAGLRRIGLSGTVGPGLDPCAAVQLHVDLPVGQEEEVCFILGQGPDRAAALELSQRYRDPDAIEAAWTATREAWRSRVDSISVHTPDAALNVILPWLLYQTLSCRIWGRSAVYQSSGAYGFRDQLQDVMALVHTRPDLTRQHILRAAGHQFEAGDVLHWWHPPSGRGVRTRFADDLLWLPFVVAQYVQATGDESILRATVPFLKGEPLRANEEERYGFYESTEERFTLYEHCRRALEQGYSVGPHGLPLMKAGDWNDGMNRVGIGGRGESVWMAWFLYMTMDRFLPLAESMPDPTSAKQYRARMADLRNAAELQAWDGAWYRRAYYDDGMPLGAARNAECTINSLAQSWAVLSGAANPDRAAEAMQAVDEHLIDTDARLVKLFTPPFDHTAHDPGYIKGYPPGIRENGGQYTHAALWVVWAFAAMGRGQRAGDLFHLLNPITHSDTREQADHYRVEPYVVAADVWSEPPHTGRGGWTWYSGSSGWMYRLAIEAILGLQREGASLRIAPAIPAEWPDYEVDYRYGTGRYHIRVENPDHVESGVASVTLDDAALPDDRVPLLDDGQTHHVLVRLGRAG